MQIQRIASLGKFKAGTRSILIATDVASRGLDIPAVDAVYNYDIPTNPKDYIHRVGRTARAGRAGNAVNFVTQYDVELFQRIESLIGLRMEKHPLEEQSVLLLLARVTEAQRQAAIELRESGFMASDRKKSKGDGAGVERDQDDADVGALVLQGSRGGGGDKKRSHSSRGNYHHSSKAQKKHKTH